MEKWKQDFERWIVADGRAESTARSYSIDVDWAGRLTGTDLSKLETKEDYWAFHWKCYSSPEFNKKNEDGKRKKGAAIAKFHDYIFSKFDDWPETKWVIGRITPDEEKRCRDAMNSMKICLQTRK